MKGALLRQALRKREDDNKIGTGELIRQSQGRKERRIKKRMEKKEKQRKARIMKSERIDSSSRQLGRTVVDRDYRIEQCDCSNR